MWETMVINADGVFFKILALGVILKISTKTLEVILRIFGSPTFVSICWTCKKQSSVSHNTTDSEIRSSNAGSRMWDLVIDVLASFSTRRLVAAE